MTGRTSQTCIGSQWVRGLLGSSLSANKFHSVLHPHHKLNYFRNAGWPTDWITTAKKLVRDEFDRNYRFRDDIAVIIRGPEGPKEYRSAKNVFDNLPAFQPIEFGTFDELTRYLAASPEDVKNENLLQWWVEHKHVYPHLSRMALDYHTVPCESTLLCVLFQTILL